jgi:hypothetical protein
VRKIGIVKRDPVIEAGLKFKRQTPVIGLDKIFFKGTKYAFSIRIPFWLLHRRFFIQISPFVDSLYHNIHRLDGSVVEPACGIVENLGSRRFFSPSYILFLIGVSINE